MKGTIVRCLAEMVTEKYGDDKWQACLADVGLENGRRFRMTEDVSDHESLQLFAAATEVLGISMQELYDAFGIHWSTKYAPENYRSWFMMAKSAKDFIKQLDRIHDVMTQNIPNAVPPRFQYVWETENKLRLTYNSKRNLIDLFISLAKGIGEYYQTPVRAQKVSANEVILIF